MYFCPGKIGLSVFVPSGKYPYPLRESIYLTGDHCRDRGFKSFYFKENNYESNGMVKVGGK